MKFRRSFFPIAISFLVTLVFANCEKENSFTAQDQEKMQKAIEGMKMAYSEAVSHNKSLKEAVSMQASDAMQFSDSSYHHHDSLYQHHYKECESLCSEGNGTGMMMNGGCSNTGVMMGNMMGGDMQMNCSVAGESCQHAMDSLRHEHSQYCLN